MISNILILIILIYLAIRLFELILLIRRRLNRRQSLTPIKLLRSLIENLFPATLLRSCHDVSKLAQLE